MFKPRVPLSLYERVRRWAWPHIGWERMARYLFYRVARFHDSSHSIASGFATGVAVSCTPLLGLHIALAFIVAWSVKGNIAASMIGTLIGNPATFPLIWLACYTLGSLILGLFSVSVDLSFFNALFSQESLWRSVTSFFSRDGFWYHIFLPMMLGSIPLSITSWCVSYYTVRHGIDLFRTRWSHFYGRMKRLRSAKTRS
ncbi:MAG: DUF2062 domain-containing protein [Alphaproteobacteria bacterium GM7ARS4]|nr:DUF2062 domain-containing protein [Alphaproteobacteria bacterium GM7ARS4]